MTLQIARRKRRERERAEKKKDDFFFQNEQRLEIGEKNGLVMLNYFGCF